MTDESRTGKVLKQAKSDLEYAEFPGYPGKLFNTIRERLLIPVTGWAGDAVPAVVHKIPLPFVDAITAFSLTVPFTAAKMSYSLLPQKELRKRPRKRSTMNSLPSGQPQWQTPRCRNSWNLNLTFYPL